jgi:hypothetical protein
MFEAKIGEKIFGCHWLGKQNHRRGQNNVI